MSKIIDLSNQRFGRLIAIEPLPKNPKRKDRSIYWKCICDCGKECEVSGSNLRTGHTLSCGCLQKERASKAKRKNLIGQVFGLLTVIDKDEILSKNNKHIYWKCKCDCGNTTSVITSSLTKGLTRSCGCLKQSYGVHIIDKILRDYDISFVKEYYCKDESNNKFYFDYFVNNNYVIEFDGQQHFQHTAGWNSKENVIKNHNKDLIKNNYCFNNNIKIIRIPYKEIDKISINELLYETSTFKLTKDNEKDYYERWYKENEL